MPPGVGDDCERIIERDDLVHARHASGLAVVNRFELPLEHRALDKRSVEHAGKPNVDAVGGAAQNLVGRVERSRRLADERPVLRILELDLRGRRHPRGRLSDRAVTKSAPAGGVNDHTFFGSAFGGRHLPLRCRRCNQHLARGRAGLAQHHL